MSKWVWLVVGAALVSGCAVFQDCAPKRDEVLILSFFRDNGQDGIYLAWSEDGVNFKPLNDDKPVIKPGPWQGQNLTRDPSMVYHDGKFHAVWTSSWRGRWFGCAESEDLKTWSDPVKVQPFPASLPEVEQPRNVWAPEICWDPVQKNYAVCWSSTAGRAAGHRIYISRTTDLKTFTEAKMFVDQGFNCIDGMMVFDPQGTLRTRNGRWVMALKNERDVKEGGKNLRLTTTPADFSKPWTPVSKPLVGPGSGVRGDEMAEGPSLLQWKGKWFLYWDAFANGHYCLATTTDLETWTDRTSELKLPPHPRHGTVFVAPRSAVAWLKTAK